MAKTFTILKTLGQVNEGQVQELLDSMIESTHRFLLEYTHLHGDKANKKVARVNLKMAFTVNNATDLMVDMTCEVVKSLPAPPPLTSTAIGARDENGKLALFVRNSGSSEVPPNQGILTTSDGRPIDQETGAVVEDESET